MAKRSTNGIGRLHDPYEGERHPCKGSPKGVDGIRVGGRDRAAQRLGRRAGGWLRGSSLDDLLGGKDHPCLPVNLSVKAGTHGVEPPTILEIEQIEASTVNEVGAASIGHHFRP